MVDGVNGCMDCGWSQWIHGGLTDELMDVLYYIVGVTNQWMDGYIDGWMDTLTGGWIH